MVEQVGFDGGCHWCTGAVFAALKGRYSVRQGWISSTGQHGSFSEEALVEYDSGIISLGTFIAIHLHTHSSTSQHSMRSRYRSAV